MDALQRSMNLMMSLVPSGEAAAGRLVVDELGVRFVQDLQTAALGPQAVVDVIEVDPECLVESGQGLEHAAPGGQARTGDGGDFPRSRRPC